ncbi:peptidase S33 tricorn interacting factor 1 [Dacryopinax primogenitus]|uniref:Peptidase S33 tricorn interacting factor 1 n=1 Tax=Dacryopinax primogenitus (strain DJM 731) TaxID=1858805 RepID=M5FVS7_DACPD|nr:peptidase S33 tricorn interacting factor 1 [Dacryopinax primogenitus]EJU00459.1 peptidase S33 tricorn interacting factor 1 [Dacryopinax primogenitus]
MDKYKPTSIGTVPFREWSTPFEVYGTIPSPQGMTPLILLHGGPGFPGRHMLCITSLAKSHGIPVICYDQLGSGNSVHLPDKPKDFWQTELWVDELFNLVEQLSLERYDLLGHSWGAMLAADYATRRPTGLRKAIIHSGAQSCADWEDSAIGRLRTMPDEVQEIIDRCEESGTLDLPEYHEATLKFLKVYGCRLDPWPVELLEALRLVSEDPTVYTVMSGRSEIHINGNLRTWDISDRLSEINVPVLIINGKYDEADDVITKRLADKIAGSQWVQFSNSSHTAMVEEQEEYLKVVGRWLVQ